MHTQNQDHEIPEPHEAGRLISIVAEARSTLGRVCCEDMAIFGVTNAWCGPGRSVLWCWCLVASVNLGLGSINTSSDSSVGHCRGPGSHG